MSRQVLFTKKDIGKYKALVSKKIVQRINKKINIEIFKHKIDKGNIDKIAKNYKINCDATVPFAPVITTFISFNFIRFSC